jgi:hypothetical protein
LRFENNFASLLFARASVTRFHKSIDGQVLTSEFCGGFYVSSNAVRMESRISRPGATLEDAMPLGRVETALSKLPVVARVIERLDAARTENAALHQVHELFENDRAEYSDRWLRENQAWILANAAPPPTAVNGGSRIAMLVTAFNCRSLNNWRPLLDSLIASGNSVYTALFPLVTDPDHEGLFDLSYPNLLTVPIGEKLQPIDGDLRGILNSLRRIVAGYGIDVVWMSTFHAGPEQYIHEALRDLDRRPVTIGLQHGMQHDWSVFEGSADKFDLFGTFGSHFYSKCSERFRLRMITCGLPKLDGIPRYERSGNIRRILFAAQNQPPFEVLKPFLRELSSITGAEIVIRPHPQWRDLYNGLSNEFVLDSVERSVIESLRDVDAVITTGSTVGLESLAAGLPTVVLPFCSGEVYEPAGIVVTKPDPNEVVSMLRRFDDAEFNAHINRFLDFVAGPKGMRTSLSVRQVERAANLTTQMQVLTANLNRKLTIV